MKIFYKNNSGQVLDFMSWPYKVSDSEVLGYEWSFDENENTGIKSGGSIQSIRKKIAKTSLTLAISARNREEYTKALETFLAVTEADILNGVPGRLYVNDSYYLCYIYGSEKKEWGGMSPYLENHIKLVSPYPFWCREVTKSFLRGNAVNVRNADTYLHYPYEYPYRYSLPKNAGLLENDHYASCDFRLLIYGSCENPAIRINRHLYQVITTLYAGEYLEIDSRSNTVVCHRHDGRTENLFNMRNKDSNLFEQIPAGRSAVSWNTAAFGFDITLFQERSEPKWIL